MGKGNQVAGWTGKLLRVDLSSGDVQTQDSLAYAPYLGGRGWGARLAWEEIPPGVGAFDPENLLMFLAGPLTGTTAPFSGRGEVCGLSAQGWPHEWYARSGMGGHWAPEMKYAGYDGIVVKGRADRPVYLLVQNDKVEIRDASHLWGMTTTQAQLALQAEHGREVKVLTIGPAGERLSRIAVVQSETESAAGQGGYGGVMGSKRLKAIVIRGTGVIRIAHPEEFLRRTLAITKEAHAPMGHPKPAQLDPQLAKYKQRFWACSQQCTANCTDCHYYEDVPGVVNPGLNRGQLHCVAALFPGFPNYKLMDYRWDIGFEAGFEIAKLANEYGLNHWDILIGMIPWLRDSQKAGLVDDLDGLKIDLNSPHFWAGLLHKIAFREGKWGEALGEGGWRAALATGVGVDIARRWYPAWGYSGHWDGHTCNPIVFPYWLVPAIQWAVDTRDPISSGHGWAQNIMRWSPLAERGESISWEKLRGVAAKVYGAENAAAFDPHSGYEAKVKPALWHTLKSATKDSMILDDNIFPRFLSVKTEDQFARTDGMEGPQYERYMFTAATGMDWTDSEFDAAAERVLQIERAIAVRNHGRSREDDEYVIPYFEVEDAWINPLLGQHYRLDAAKFRQMLDEFYAGRGWDVKTGVPTRERLEALGMHDVAEELEQL